MHARVVTALVEPDRVGELYFIYESDIAYAAQQQRGFKGTFLLTDDETGKVMSITLWETEADMLAGETSGYYREQLAKYSGPFASPPTPEHYEVKLQRFPD